MAYPTPAEIDAAVPVSGTPSRALTNAALKAIVGAASYTPDDGTVPTRSVASGNFTGGRLKAAPATDPDDCVTLVQLPSTATAAAAGLVKLASDTAQTVAPAAVSATAARTYAVQLNAAGAAVVNVPWANTTYSAVTTTTAGLMAATDKVKLDALPVAADLLVKAAAAPETATSPGTLGQFYADNDYLYICVATDSWLRTSMTSW